MTGLRLGAAAAVVLSACGPSSAAAVARGTASPIPSPTPEHIVLMNFGGIQRAYAVFRPLSLDPQQAVPLVIVMHGWTQDSAGVEEMTGYSLLATHVGFEVVYPQGVDDSWNAGSCCAQNANDDVGFISAVIDRLVSAGGVDPKRIYAAGMSNGGMMAMRLGCELANKIDAVAAISGVLVVDRCHPVRPISLLDMHGLLDDEIPYLGGTFTFGRTYTLRATPDVTRQWAGIDGCRPAPSETDTPLMNTYVWSGCQAGTAVVLDEMNQANHVWFGPGDIIGEPSATQESWNFFTHAPPLT